MKRYLLLLLILLSGLTRAQSWNGKLFVPEDKGYHPENIIGYAHKSFYTALVLPTSGSASPTITLCRFDSAFKATGEASFSALHLKDGTYDFYTWLFLDERLYFFYTRYKKGTRYLIAAEVDLKALKLKGTYEHISSSVKTMPSEYINGHFDGDYYIVPSGSGQHFAVIYIENKVTKAILFDAELKKLWTSEYNVNVFGFLLDVRVRHDGRIYLLHRNNMTPPESWMLAELDSGTASGHLIPNEEKEFNRGAIGFTPAGDPFVAGYYNYYKDAYFRIRNAGTWFFSPSQNAGKVVLQPFSLELLSRGQSDYQKNQLKKDFEKYGCAGAEGIYNFSLLVDEKGGIYLIGEEAWDISTGGNIIATLAFSAAATALSSQLTVVPVTGGGNLSIENLLVTRLDSLGIMQQNTWVQKKQVNDVHAGYYALAYNDSLYLFFNDHEDNITDPPDNDAEVEKLRSTAKSVPVLIAVAADGKKKQYLPFGIENNMQVYMRGALMSGSGVIFCLQVPGVGNVRTYGILGFY
ncbi:MAG: hypothetical protein AB1458_12315 [Bacteroidota bacterium]